MCRGDAGVLYLKCVGRLSSPQVQRRLSQQNVAHRVAVHHQLQSAIGHRGCAAAQNDSVLGLRQLCLCGCRRWCRRREEERHLLVRAKSENAARVQNLPNHPLPVDESSIRAMVFHDPNAVWAPDQMCVQPGDLIIIQDEVVTRWRSANRKHLLANLHFLALIWTKRPEEARDTLCRISAIHAISSNNCRKVDADPASARRKREEDSNRLRDWFNLGGK